MASHGFTYGLWASLVLVWALMVSLLAQDLYPLPNTLRAPDPDAEEEEPTPMPIIPKRDEAQGPRDCSDILNENPDSESGVYTIYPPNCIMCYYNVYCDMEKEGGGWTVLARRFNGSLDFYRGWYFYKMGFGDVFSEYYLGNDRIHQLTTYRSMELKICMTDVGDMEMSAGYSHFYIGNMTEGYPLHVDSFYGDAEDYLIQSNNSRFSTFDSDADGAPQNCAKYFHSAWWYHTYGANCGSQSNLFGYYFLGRKELPHFAGPGLSWKPVPGPGGPAVKSFIMKIRPLGYIGGSKLDGVQKKPISNLIRR